jgi:hypothetical protein
MKPEISSRVRPARRRAFSLIEVMIAMGIYFMAMFSILALTSQLLSNARLIQATRKPSVSLVHAWWTSKTNRVVDGLTPVDFSDLSPELGELYRDYSAEIFAEPDLDMTNGLWNVTYKVLNRRTGQVESEAITLFWDPNSRRGQAGQGALR